MTRRYVFSLMVLLSLLIGLKVYSQSEQKLSPLMGKNYEALVDIQNVLSLSQPNTTIFKQKIKADIDTLKGSSVHLKNVLDKEGKTGMSAIATIMGEYIDDMDDALAKGHYDYVRNQASTLSGFCMSCHTGMNNAKNFGVKAPVANRLKGSQKIQFLAATRQFDQAIDEFKALQSKALVTPEDVNDYLASLKIVASIAVRVKEDPTLASSIAQWLSRKTDLPKTVQYSLKQWVKDIDSWKSEPKVSANPQQLVAKLKSLNEHAKEVKRFPMDHAGDFTYLRMSGLAFKSLAQPLDKNAKAQTLFYLGIATNALDDPLLWDMDRYYFEACIREMPHTSAAIQCFDYYSAEVYFSYGGSAGVNIPLDESKKIGELRRLSE